MRSRNDPVVRGVLSLPGYIHIPGGCWEHYSWTKREHLMAEIERLRKNPPPPFITGFPMKHQVFKDAG